MFTNQMRMSGFSGIDVADMVSQMMRAESFRLNRFTQQRQILTWQQESIRSVSNNIFSFKTNFTRINALTGPTGINNPANFRGFTPNITNTTGTGSTGNTNGINITATATARSGNHTVSVEQVAQSDAFRGQRHEGVITSNQISFSSFVSVDNSGTANTAGTFGVNINGTVRQINVSLGDAAAGNPEAESALNAIAQLQSFDSNAEQGRITLARAGLSGIAGTGSNQTGFTLDQMTAEGFDVDTIENEALRTEARIFLNEIADANSAIAANSTAIETHERALQSNAAFMANFVNRVNQGLSGFGTNPNSTSRAYASFDAVTNNFSIGSTAGNTVTITAASMESMNFDRNTTNFNTNQTLGEFMGLHRVNDSDGNFSHWSDTAGGSAVSSADTTFSFSIQQGGSNVEFTFDIYANEDLTLQQMMNQVNNDARLNVRMAFDNISGSFTIESSQMGSGNAINSITDNDGILTRMFNPTSAGAPGANAETLGNLDLYRTREAADAVVTVNGNQISRDSNQFVVDGMNITINAGAVGQTFNVNMQGDTGTTRQMIADFVEAYNNIVREIQELTNIPRPRQQGGRGHFMPLTDDQRAAMSDREVEQWETQARTGILHRDQHLRTVLADMRNEMSRVIELEGGGTFSLTQMGISLSRNTADGGLLVIDQTALNYALENNMDAVVAMFTGEGASAARGPGATGILGNMGAVARLDAALNRHVNGLGTGNGLLEQRAGRVVGTGTYSNNELNRRIADQDARIETMMRFLERRENQLFAQFSRMEQAMMQANSQMGFLDQFIWGGM